MSTAFWIRRFLVVLALAFTIICVAQLLKGRGLEYSLTQATIWGPLSSLVFTVARYFQARRGHHCAICQDTPEMRAATRHQD
ncbi:hypothetical protein [Xanthomonas maliensis]|uniref:hypothetical protein n=1 Tax=Xanthomonas maliensis TaxID=1321368 RepID=UPI0003A339B8|nr:hypothetical protein [Xanthomonas maliensis]KAB7769841.1 hypothetical protein CKY51_06015 [Xanthomonas maliensis]